VEHEIKGAVGGKKKITNSLSIQSPHENLRPRNIRTFTLGTNPMRLTTGLIERTADPKAHLIAALYGALQD
jgi:hypothetical protein